MTVSFFSFVLTALAVWRITHLLAEEDGPFDMIFLFRRWLGKSVLGRLFDCFYCLSIWTAIPFAVWLGSEWKECVVLWLALSGAACLLQKATAKNEVQKPPDYFED